MNPHRFCFWIGLIGLGCASLACEEKIRNTSPPEQHPIVLESAAKSSVTGPPDASVRKSENTAKRRPAVLPGESPPGAIPPGSCDGSSACEAGCERGEIQACGVSALLAVNGWGTEQNDERAKRFAEKGCAEKDAMSCGVLARVLASERGAAGAKKSEELFVFACENGDLISCETLGERWAARNQTGTDPRKALSYFLQACDAGHVRACLGAVAVIQESALETDRDVNGLLRKVCDSGFSRGCLLLGHSLRRGSAGPVDHAGAKSAYDEACQLGELKACE